MNQNTNEKSILKGNNAERLGTFKIKNNNMKPFLVILISLIGLVGEVKCIYKAATCNWEPIGKSEVFYTLSAFTGLGVVVGYINIQDK